jgi:hypothetical protein
MLDLICSSIARMHIKVASEVRFQACFTSKALALCTISGKPKRPTLPIIILVRYQPGGKVNSGREVQCCRVTFLQLFAYITYRDAKISIHVPLWRSDVCHLPIHVISCIHT